MMKYSRILSAPSTYVGWGAVNELIVEIKQGDTGKVLVVMDPFLQKIGLLDRIFGRMRQDHILFDVYTNIIPEPTLDTARELVAYARADNYSTVIGIGGGSALDLAKLAAVFVGNDGDISDYLNLTGSKKIQHKGLSKVLIPTTSGTGSEVTDISVLSLGKTKDVVVHEYLKADLAIVDPELTVSVPPKVTAATGADALTHAIEAYLSVNSTPFSDALALEAIRLIGGALPVAVKDGENRDARTDMSYGSYLAGLAFYNAGVGAVHALAYPLGGEFHIPHGDSNAVMLPYVLGFIQDSCHTRLAHVYEVLEGVTSREDDGAGASKCIDKLVALIREVGIPSTLQEFGIPESSLSLLASQGIAQKRLLSRCPMPLEEQDIYEIYLAAFKGEIFRKSVERN